MQQGFHRSHCSSCLPGVIQYSVNTENGAACCVEGEALFLDLLSLGFCLRMEKETRRRRKVFCLQVSFSRYLEVFSPCLLLPPFLSQLLSLPVETDLTCVCVYKTLRTSVLSLSLFLFCRIKPASGDITGKVNRAPLLGRHCVAVEVSLHF